MTSKIRAMQQRRPCKLCYNLENNSHPEFISGYTKKRCAKLVQHDKD
ncbi:hypothetical protein [Rickettsia endosymbiont of Orchestes rusci]